MNKLLKIISDNGKRMAIPIMTHPGIEILNKRVVDAVTDGIVHYNSVEALVQKYNLEVCTTIMDLTVEAEAFGAKIDIPENELPSVIDRLVFDSTSVSKLEIPDLLCGRVPEFLKATTLIVENIKRPVLPGCIGPFSLAARLYDMSEIMMGMYSEPKVIKSLLTKCTDFLILYCLALKKIGALGVMMAEPVAGLLSGDDCMQYSTYYVKKIVKAVQSDDFSIVLHNCGNKGQCTKTMIESGANALHFGNVVKMENVLKECPRDIVVMGNIDPVSILKQSTSEMTFDITLDLLKRTSKFENFVLSSGCDMPPHTPDANIKAFYNALKTFNSDFKN